MDFETIKHKQSSNVVLEDFYFDDYTYKNQFLNKDVIIICFSVVNPASFENVEPRWMYYMQRQSLNLPIILCGTKIDLREDPIVIARLAGKNAKPVTREEGEAKAKKIGALAYIETSALKGINVEKCIELAVAAKFANDVVTSFKNDKKCTLQ